MLAHITSSLHQGLHSSALRSYIRRLSVPPHRTTRWGFYHCLWYLHLLRDFISMHSHPVLMEQESGGFLRQCESLPGSQSGDYHAYRSLHLPHACSSRMGFEDKHTSEACGLRHLLPRRRVSLGPGSYLPLLICILEPVLLALRDYDS